MVPATCYREARFRIACLAASLLCVIGCDTGPAVHPAKGRVVIKGQGPAQSLAGYSVQLQSTTDAAEMPGGMIEADGAFVLHARAGGAVVPGAKAGTYRACLSPPSVEGGPPPRLAVPRRYLSLDTAQWQVTIKPGENELTLEVEQASSPQ